MKRLIIPTLFLALALAACGSEATIIQTETDGDTESVADGDADSEQALDGDQNEGERLADGDTEAESEATKGEAEPSESDQSESDAADGDTTPTCDATACAIAGTCYATGALDPASPCRKCDPETSRTAWTNLAYAATCNDGNACTKEDKCDGQGACKGTPDAACQADGDAEYDPDIDPDEVAQGEPCPETGLRICRAQAVVSCNGQYGWSAPVNCADEGYACLDGNCISPSDPRYSGCSLSEYRCVGSSVQCCDDKHTWITTADCASEGYACLFGQCVKS